MFERDELLSGCETGNIESERCAERAGGNRNATDAASDVPAAEDDAAA